MHATCLAYLIILHFITLTICGGRVTWMCFCLSCTKGPVKRNWHQEQQTVTLWTAGASPTPLLNFPDQQCSDIIIANAICPLPFTTNEFKSRPELALFWKLPPNCSVTLICWQNGFQKAVFTARETGTETHYESASPVFLGKGKFVPVLN
jgi:hypothetical protein